MKSPHHVPHGTLLASVQQIAVYGFPYNTCVHVLSWEGQSVPLSFELRADMGHEVASTNTG
jgi:hypothetical protein